MNMIRVLRHKSAVEILRSRSKGLVVDGPRLYSGDQMEDMGLCFFGTDG